MPEGFDGGSSNYEELSERELTWGYWFVTHKEELKRYLIVSLIVLSVLLYGYVFYRVTRMYAFEQDEYNRALSTATENYIDIQAVHDANRIEDIQVLSRQIIPGTDGNVDVIARVRNPNTKWALESFTYRFGVGTDVLEEQQGFLLPGEEKFLMALNVRASAGGTPQILVDNEKWQRVVQYETWGPEHSNFLVTEQKFTAARQGEISGQLPISEVSAVLKNNSAYNYNQVEVQIALYSGNRVVGVNRLPLPNFRSGETRTLSAIWSMTLPSVSNVEIIPTVNILTPSSYLDFEGTFDPSFLEIDSRF
jgi:hypothetical protein